MTPQLSHILIYRRKVFVFKGDRTKHITSYHVVQTWVIQLETGKQKEFKVGGVLQPKLGKALAKAGRAQKEDGFILFGDPIIEVEKKARKRKGR